jgi:rRNA small subunit pseudouridine methyltransferase Nep1
LIIADAALETVPKNLLNHPSLKKMLRNGDKNIHGMLLDRTFHHFGMVSNRLPEGYRRGRPDIIHVALLCSLSTPLFKKNHLKVFVHTFNDNLIVIGNNVRIPKSYTRFEGLVLDLMKNKKIVSPEGNLLLEFFENISFGDIVVKHVKPDVTIGLSITGSLKPTENVARELSHYDNPCVVIGGFPKGHFSKGVDFCLDKKYSIYPDGLETHVVVSRLLYEFEKIVDN